jgi:hypothetical protein
VTLLTGLTTLAALLGLAIWRGWGTRGIWPFYRPVALLLAWAPLHDVAQWAIGAYARAGAARPYTGSAAIWFHIKSALLLSWPAALLGVALVVFRRRSPWPAAVLWAVASAGAALAYPALRLDPRWAFYAAFTGACCAGVFALGGIETARRLREGEILMAHHLVPLALTVGQASALFAYARGVPVDDWIVARTVQFIAFGAVVSYETLTLWMNRRGS